MTVCYHRRAVGSLQPGDRVLHYQVEARIGAGGMGTVWRARDTRLDRPVALKFLADTVTADQRGRERLVREARLASRLKHRNICTVHALEEVDDSFFIVMELVEGKSLAAELEAGPLPVERALAIADQLLDGLAAAHAQGLVHRDIKPANLLIEADGAVKIADFGLAWSTDSSRLSSTGMAMGTLAYASPEQVDGKEIDARTDLYSSGVVLYQMLAGELPLRAEHPSAWVRLIVSEPPPPVGDKRPEVPQPVQEAVARALAKEPAARFESAAAMRTALGGGTSPRLQPAARPRRSRRALVLGAALLVAAGAGGAAWYATSGPAREGATTAAPADEPGPGEPQTAAALALHREAQELLRNEDWTGARARLEQVVALEPDAAMAHALLALAVRDLGYWARAQDAGRQARLLAGDLPRERKLVILIIDAFVRQQGAEMIAAARELIALRPDDLEAGILMLWAQGEAKEPAGSRELIDRLRRRPPPAGDDPRLDRLEAIIEPDPERKAALSTRCRQRALRAGRKLAAIDCLMGQGAVLPDDAIVAHADQVIAEARAAGYPAPVIDAHLQAADTLRKLGNPDEAARRYRAAIAAADELGAAPAANLWIGLAYALNDADRPSEALAAADEALRLCNERMPGCAYSAERTRAHALNRGGDRDGARAALERAIADARRRGHFEDLFGAVEQLAQSDIDRGDWQGAEDGYQRYLDWARQSGNREAEGYALFQLGRLHADQDRVDQARRERTQAVAIADELGLVAEGKEQGWRSALALIILQQGDAAAAEVEARHALEHGGKDNNLARSVLVRALARQGKLREARVAYEVVQPEEGWYLGAGGDLALAAGDKALATRVAATARQMLAAAPAHEPRRNLYTIRLELGRAELVLGVAGARERLEALRKEAEAGGYKLYARHARELLDRRP
jgi:serine/threonine-protein kinase